MLRFQPCVNDYPLTAELLERLLYEDEGVALDFKRDPYPFEGAEPHQKAELLKDILAFANAWRRATAYVLIGVEEVQGARGIVRGVESHPDDAALQQFINGKTNRPVEFRYRAHSLDGKQVGVLEIPVQDRPLYLAKDYSKLKAHTVYVRRSSSTDIASPDEVAKMGAGEGLSHAPDIAVTFGHAGSDDRLGDALAAQCTSFQIPARLPNYSNAASLPGGYRIDLGMSNSAFYREFAAHCQDTHRLRGVQVAVDNGGSGPLIGGRVVVRAPLGTGFIVADEVTPEPNRSMPTLAFRSHPLHAEWTVVKRGAAWEAHFDVGTVHPGGTAWTETLYLGGTATGEYPVELTVLAENLPAPYRRDVTVALDVRQESLSFERIQAWANGSPPLDLLT